MARSNSYPGRCENPACKVNVAPNAGYITKPNGRWVTWCSKCCPERIEAAAPVVTVRQLTADGKIITPYEPANLPLLRSFPGAKWDGSEKCWRISLSDSDRARVLELADRLGLDVAASLRVVKVTEQAVAADLMGLYPFQVAGVNFLATGDKRLLGDDMGVGKTVQSLRALPANARALVVCPAGIKFNWRDEAKRWRPDLTPVVLKDKSAFRAPQAGEVLIANYESLPEWLSPPAKGKDGWKAAEEKLNAFRKELKVQHPDYVGVQVISDEAHRAKNSKAIRSGRIRELGHLTGKIWGLTGTPLLNRPPDLYGVLEALGLEKDAFGHFGKFMCLFNAQKGRYGIEWGCPRAEVPEMLRRVMLRRTRAEVLPDLPRKTYTSLTVNGLSASLRKKMDELAEEWLDAMDATDSLPPFEEFSALRAELAASRTDAVAEYVEDCEEQDIPLVVASAHRAPIDALQGRDGWAVITGDTKPEDRQTIVNRFQNGELKGVGLTIAAGGVGLTLTRAWRMLFVDLDWTPANNAQAEDRICRIGQVSDKVEIVRMVSDHVLDQHVLRLIARKIALIEGAVERTVAAHVPAPAVPVAAEQGETSEAFAARQAETAVKRAAWEAENAAKLERDAVEKAKSKAQRIIDRNLARDVKPLPLTDERKEAVVRGLEYMLSVCDGAESLDGQGFGKSDAMMAHCILPCIVATDEGKLAAWMVLQKYHRQLKNREPLLFGDAV